MPPPLRRPARCRTPECVLRRTQQATGRTRRSSPVRPAQAQHAAMMAGTSIQTQTALAKAEKNAMGPGPK
jgi:hypothetical protein